jgi:isochorismate hydrolase
MKVERYFTSENYDQKVNEWQAILMKYYSSKRPFTFVPEKTALLIIDMQEYFVNPQARAFAPSSRTIIQPIVRLKQAFKQKGLSVYFTRHGFSPEAGKERVIMRWWKESLRTDDPLYAIAPELQPMGERIINKSNYDAFINSELPTILEKNGYQRLVITGILTHICCESTARSAFENDYEVYLPIDCLASYNEDLHISSLKVAAHAFGIPTTSKKLLEVLA